LPRFAHKIPQAQRVPGLFPVLVLCLLPVLVFGKGTSEEAEKPVQNSEWILCVTNFDMSALPANYHIVGEVITRSLVDTINTLDHRIRISKEYAYYEGYAWSQSRLTAAKALASKRDERDLLIYKGEPAWRYRRDLKTIDEAIVKLEEALAKTEAETPLIAETPAFRFSDSNNSGAFPPPPVAGGEYRFCQGQKADGFLTGKVIEYHGRMYITIRLYVIYTRSFIYEDNIIFSPDDAQDAVNEIAGRLIAALAGSGSAMIAVKAEPEDTLVLINKTFAGRGNIAPREHPPGKVTVSLSAENHAPQTVETELVPGEITEIEASLRPLDKVAVDIEVPGQSGVLVYQGALYVGEAPLTLRLPVNQFGYVRVENSVNETAQAVFRTPAYSHQTDTLSLKTKIPPPSGQKRVDKARRRYYWAWGGTWVAGIAAWISYGLFTTYNTTYKEAPIEIVGTDMSFYNQTNRLYYISGGAIILLGVAVAHEFFQMGRYIYASGQDAAPIRH
jgi:hypothetical protein